MISAKSYLIRVQGNILSMWVIIARAAQSIPTFRNRHVLHKFCGICDHFKDLNATILVILYKNSLYIALLEF